MSEWKKVKIDFATIKLGDYIEPIKTTVADTGDKNPTVYGVTNKDGISQTGKPASKDISNYIVLEKDCFAFNPYRINVGSIGINDENLKGCVSPAYVVFKTKNGLLPKFLYFYLKSDYGIHLINWYGNRGGVRNALRYSDLCKIDIPDIRHLNQEKLLKTFSSASTRIDELNKEIEKQKSYAKQLRQNILQEAIEGKLTADWRKQHPVQKGNPDYDAEALFDKIQAEKKLSKSKVRSSNNIQEKIDDDFVLDIPQNWLFVNLSELGDLERGKSKHRPRNDVRLFSNGKYPFVQTGDVSQSKYYGYEIQPASKFYNDFGLAQSKMWKAGTLCITIAANIAETGFLTYDACFPDSVVGFTPYIDGDFSNFVRYYIDSIKVILEKYAPATAQKNINLGILETLKIPFPPLAEQKEIVARVEQHIQTITQLETQIATRETTTKQLMQSILKDAFEED
jgi:restriction endonuclease S subunit